MLTALQCKPVESAHISCLFCSFIPLMDGTSCFIRNPPLDMKLYGSWHWQARAFCELAKMIEERSPLITYITCCYHILIYPEKEICNISKCASKKLAEIIYGKPIYYIPPFLSLSVYMYMCLHYITILRDSRSQVLCICLQTVSWRFLSTRRGASSSGCPVEWREIFMTQSVGKCK